MALNSIIETDEVVYVLARRNRLADKSCCAFASEIRAFLVATIVPSPEQGSSAAIEE